MRTDPEVTWPEGHTNTAATGAPTISGTPRSGETLTAETSGISDADGTSTATFQYQWIAHDGTNDADIDGATEASYALTDDEVGRTIKVRVTFTDDEGTTETLTSVATDTVEGIPATVSIADASGTEGEQSSIGFTVTLDKAESRTVTVDYATADDTATAGSDYTATSGTLTFEGGTTSKTITVPIADDESEESDETFTLTLSNPSYAELGRSTATGTIQNRAVTVGTTPLLTITGGKAKEGDETSIAFTVTLDPAATGSVSVDYATADGTAESGKDYTATPMSGAASTGTAGSSSAPRRSSERVTVWTVRTAAAAAAWTWRSAWTVTSTCSNSR